MFATVLVPLDGSGFAEIALPVARRLVSRSGGRLHLTTAGQVAPVLVGAGEITAPLAGMVEQLRRDDEAYLARTATELGVIGEGPVRVSLIEGAAGEAICEEAGRLGADLIVMATHGRNAMSRIWLGSVADYVVRHAARPVLLVKPERLGGLRPDRPIRQILVPVDQSEGSELILEPALEAARLLGAGVTLLTIIAPQFDIRGPDLPAPVPAHPGVVARRSDLARRRLERLAWQYRRPGLPISTRVAIAGTAVSGILGVLNEERFDLVALATRGTAGLRRLVEGSVGDKVLRISPKPVLLYHPEIR